MPENAGFLSEADIVALARTRPWATSTDWGAAALESFPARLRTAVRRWDLAIERAHLDGAGFPVLDVRDSSHRPMVLKLGGVGSDTAHQARIFTAADGHGYVRLLDDMADVEALLLERLGTPLHTTTPNPHRQVDVIAGLLEQVWQLPLRLGLPTTPEEKARGLLEILGDASGRGVSSEPMERAVATARDLVTQLAADPGRRQVVVHGDPHPGNVLEAGPDHAFIDPDGFRCEPEYDAGVCLRDHQQHLEDLLRVEGRAAAHRFLADLAERLAHLLDLDAERILAWAFVERVTTGVHLQRLGYVESSASWLTTAGRLVS